MGDTFRGVLSAADIILLTDSLSTVFKGSYASFQSLTTSIQTMRGKVLGDGTQAGLSNANFKASCQVPISNKLGSSKYDINFQRTDMALVSLLNSNVSGNTPSGWSFSGLQPLDAYLTYLNGNSASTPATPASAGTLVGTNVSGGGLTTVASGSAPRVVHCLVGSTNYYVSQPSAEATQVALTGSQNAYTYTIGGTVPSGVFYVAIFRGVPGGSGGTYYYDQLVPCTPLASYPVITISQPDNQLRTDWSPPSWCSCLMTAEFATLYALSTSTLPTTNSDDTKPLMYKSGRILSPNNVLLSPSNSWLGSGNVPQGAIFGTHDISTSYASGTIQTANVTANNIQGFCGSLGKGAQSIILRTTTNLNGSWSPTFSYVYTDATHPTTPQTQTGITPSANFAGSVPETVYLTVMAGRLVSAVTETGHTGGGTAGVFLCESNYSRTY